MPCQHMPVQTLDIGQADIAKVTLDFVIAVLEVTLDLAIAIPAQRRRG